MAENSGPNQGGRFQPGQSGNPAGKPRGARHKTTLLAEKLMQDDAADVVKKVIEAAKGGDMTAARIVLDRIAPARRDNPVTFELPKIERSADAANAMGAILAAVADGAMTPGEAAEIGKLLDNYIKTLEATEFEARLRALEERATVNEKS
jgi:hypothetical protein